MCVIENFSDFVDFAEKYIVSLDIYGIVLTLGGFMAKVTIQDISRHANVSIATVSRVLNKKGNVSPALEARVTQVSKELGYKQAESLQPPVNRPKLIAVLVPSLTNPFYNDILDGIQDTAANHKYHMVVLQSKTEVFGYDSQLAEFLNSNVVDGLITLEHAYLLQELYSTLRPGQAVVQCCEYDESLPYPYVAIDDFRAAYNAVSYLATTGRKRIAFLNSSTRTLYGKKREAGYRQALEDLNLEMDPRHCYHLNAIEFNVAFSAALKMLSSENPPDAVFAVSDIYAVAAIRAARKLGMRVPGDVAVVGFDNIELAAVNEPPLTTVNMPRYEIGSTAATTLFGIIKKRPPLSSGMLLETELVVRGST